MPATSTKKKKKKSKNKNNRNRKPQSGAVKAADAKAAAAKDRAIAKDAAAKDSAAKGAAAKDRAVAKDAAAKDRTAAKDAAAKDSAAKGALAKGTAYKDAAVNDTAQKSADAKGAAAKDRAVTKDAAAKEAAPKAAAKGRRAPSDVSQFIYLRVIACIAIVLLHTLFASNVYFKDTITDHQLLVSTTVQHLLMWAVPCFLMVTGALLLQPARKINNRKLFGKYIRRIALALVFFTFFFQWLDHVFGGEKSVLKSGLSDLIQGHGWPHMWYLYLMLGLYLMVPFYKMVTDRASDRQLWQLAATMIVFISLIPLLQYAGAEEIGFYIPTAVIYPVYMFAGYALYRKNIPALEAAAIFAVSTGLILALSIKGIDAEIYGYDSILVIAQSLSLFSLALRIRKTAGTVVRSIDRCGFGIYLIHMIGVVFVMKWVGYDPYTHNTVLSFAVMTAVFFIASYSAAWLIRLIPKLDLL